MFSKAIYVSLFVFSLTLQGHAHGGINPALGVKGTITRSEVQRPNSNKPCGSINPATTIDNSQTATVDGQGNVQLTVTNFNPGADGSRKVTAQVSDDGTGDNLKTATVTTNGDATPTNVGSQSLVVQLPQGTKCTGGKNKDICLLALKTTSGFGNCVAVKQANGAAAGGDKGTADVAAGAAGAVKQGGNGAANAVAGAAGAASNKKMTAVDGSVSKTGANDAQKDSNVKGSNNGQKGKDQKGKDQKGKAEKGTHDNDKDDGKGKGSGQGQKGVNDAAKGGADMKKSTPNNVAMDQNAKAAKPAGARAVRSLISSQRDVVKRSGFFSWIWA